MKGAVRKHHRPALRHLWRWLPAVAGVLVAGLAFATIRGAGSRAQLKVDLERAIQPAAAPQLASYVLPLPESLNDPAEQRAVLQALPDDATLRLVVRAGDTLGTMLTRAGLDSSEANALVNTKTFGARLKQLRIGDVIEVEPGIKGQIQTLHFNTESPRSLVFQRQDNGTFSARAVTNQVERRLMYGSGVIKGSLFGAAQKAGIDDQIIMALAEVFAWQIDFAKDLHPGDRFSVVYEELYLDGMKVDNGRILAAHVSNQGKSFDAVLFTGPNGEQGYYTPAGYSLKRTFLRTPLKFTRISSLFSNARRHPILNRIRAHRGVDYAAPSGTPVRAAGDGRVALVGWKGGYGRAILIRHDSGYDTMYGHLSGWARGLRAGQHVSQGQLIGYVGMSGLATGPHLHYELHIQGRYVDPLKITQPPPQPIAANLKPSFLAQTRPLLAQLQVLQRLANRQDTFSNAAGG